MKRIFKIIINGIFNILNIISCGLIRRWNTLLNDSKIGCKCRVYKDDYNNAKCCKWK